MVYKKYKRNSYKKDLKDLLSFRELRLFTKHGANTLNFKNYRNACIQVEN